MRLDGAGFKKFRRGENDEAAGTVRNQIDATGRPA